MNKSKLTNLIILVVVALLLIPQTRKPIQVLLHKGITLIVKPSVVDASERQILRDYNWKLQNVNGKTFNLKEAKGKVIVVNFWATWCPPCIAEMPSLQALYQNYQSHEDVEFLFVSNEEEMTIEGFMKKKNYSFPVYQPLTQYPTDFNVSAIPRTFIINRHGEIVIDETGAADWESEAVKSIIEDMLKGS